MTNTRDSFAPLQDFQINELLGHSWRLTNGFKSTYWGAFFLILLANLIVWGVLACIGYYFIHYMGFSKESVGSISSTIQTIICMPLYVGLMILGIRRAEGLEVKALDIFNVYSYFFGLLGVYILETVILAIFSFITAFLFSLTATHPPYILWLTLAILFGIVTLYLMVSYIFSLAIRVLKGLGVWNCLETSRKAVTKHWFKVFFLLIILFCLIVLSIIPLLIGTIWVFPWVNTAIGVLYVRLLGVENNPVV